MYTSSVHSNESNYLTLTKMTVARFGGTGSFLTRYADGDKV
jgi:hypothetical protein